MSAKPKLHWSMLPIPGAPAPKKCDRNDPQLLRGRPNKTSLRATVNETVRKLWPTAFGTSNSAGTQWVWHLPQPFGQKGPGELVAEAWMTDTPRDAADVWAFRVRPPARAVDASYQTAGEAAAEKLWATCNASERSAPLGVCIPTDVWAKLSLTERRRARTRWRQLQVQARTAQASWPPGKYKCTLTAVHCENTTLTCTVQFDDGVTRELVFRCGPTSGSRKP